MEGDESRRSLIENRKEDHVEICSKEDLSTDYIYWDDVRLVHDALPEVDLDEVDTSVTVFGRRLKAPIVISAMTGGFGKAAEINERLASVAEEFGLGMGVGSQRAALENPDLQGTYSVINKFEIPLKIANLGIPQLLKQGKKKALSVDEGRAAMEMVGAHLLAIHLNYLQEVVQPEGDSRARGALEALTLMASKLPVLAKETGAGISRDVALRLKRAGVKGIDVGGLGGTSFSAVEYFRARAVGDNSRSNIGQTFWDWGIPTPVSVVVANVGLPLIATGGLRSGLDVARSVAIGASCAGMAGRLLPAALKDRDKLAGEVSSIIDELKAAMFLVGARNIEQLSSAKAIITGRSREWLDHLME